MGTKARPAQLRPCAAVRQWQAAQARRAARDAAGLAGGVPYSWPDDRQAILGEVAVAGFRRGNDARGPVVV